MSRLTVFIFLLLSFTALQAQPGNIDCNSADVLCAQQPIAANNTGGTDLPGFCPATTSALWYTFTTNSQGGEVNIALSDIDCPAVLGMDNELSLVVLAGDGTCDLTAFTAASICDADSIDFTVTTAALLPNTMYWVLVAGMQDGGATLPAQCGFTLEMSGPGADIVGVDFFAGEDVEIGEGQVVQLQATGGTTYQWTPSTGLSGDQQPNPFAQPGQTTLYTVTTTINGCTYTDEVLVEVVRLIDPPNTFTPNGDGINDFWTIRGIEDYPDSEVLIYDRWGQRVYQSIGYRDPWDGRNGGRELPMATYFYHIELNQLEGRSPPYTGSITIIR